MIAYSDWWNIVSAIFIAHFLYAGNCTSITSSLSLSKKDYGSTTVHPSSAVDYSFIIQPTVSMDALKNLESQSLKANQFQSRSSVLTSFPGQINSKSLSVQESVNESSVSIEGSASPLGMVTVHSSLNLTQTLSDAVEAANYSNMQSSTPFLRSTKVSEYPIDSSTLTHSKSNQEEGKSIDEQKITRFKQYVTTQVLVCSSIVLESFVTITSSSTTQLTNKVFSNTSSSNQLNTTGNTHQNQPTNKLVDNTTLMSQLYLTEIIQQSHSASVNQSESASLQVQATDLGIGSTYSIKYSGVVDNQTKGLASQVIASGRTSATINGEYPSNITHTSLKINATEKALQANDSVGIIKIPSSSMAINSTVLYLLHMSFTTGMKSNYIMPTATSAMVTATSAMTTATSAPLNELDSTNRKTTEVMTALSTTSVSTKSTPTVSDTASQAASGSICFYKIVVIEQEEPTTVPTTKPGTTGIVINIPSSKTGSKVLETMFTIKDSLLFQSKTLQRAEILLEISNRTSSLALAIVQLINATLSKSLKSAELTKESFLYISHIDFLIATTVVTSRLVFHPWAKITPELIYGILNETLFMESHELHSADLTMKVEVGSLQTQDFDECKLPIGAVCSAVAICVNLPSALSFSCTCPTNYEGNGFQCVEVAKTIDKVVPIILAAVFALMVVFLCGVIIYVIKKNATLAKVTVSPHLQYMEQGT